MPKCGSESENVMNEDDHNGFDQSSNSGSETERGSQPGCQQETMNEISQHGCERESQHVSIAL